MDPALFGGGPAPIGGRKAALSPEIQVGSGVGIGWHIVWSGAFSWACMPLPPSAALVPPAISLAPLQVWAEEVARDEIGHVRILREALGAGKWSAASSRPQLGQAASAIENPAAVQ